ncbi:MAG: type II toxin-antitoxin system VapC family toxin [Candidatus Dormibacteraceae bacterium]
MIVSVALADTSLFIGREQSRFDSSVMPSSLSVSMITVGELKLGVLAAQDPHVRAARLRTLSDALALEPLPVDEIVADAWAELRITLREVGRKLPSSDSWIAATAIAHGLSVATQDDDYDDIPGLLVIKL